MSLEVSPSSQCMLGIADEDVREKTTEAQQAQQRISQRF